MKLTENQKAVWLVCADMMEEVYEDNPRSKQLRVDASFQSPTNREETKSLYRTTVWSGQRKSLKFSGHALVFSRATGDLLGIVSDTRLNKIYNRRWYYALDEDSLDIEGPYKTKWEAVRALGEARKAISTNDET